MFTREETNLMILYNPGKRLGLIVELEDMLYHLTDDEAELIALTQSTLEKLSTLTDKAFDALGLSLEKMDGF